MTDTGMDDGGGPRLHIVLAMALISIVIGGTVDLSLDRPSDWMSFHVVFETLMIAGAMVMATTLWLGWWHSEHSVAELRRSLATTRRTAAKRCDRCLVRSTYLATFDVNRRLKLCQDAATFCSGSLT